MAHQPGGYDDYYQGAQPDDYEELAPDYDGETLDRRDRPRANGSLADPPPDYQGGRRQQQRHQQPENFSDLRSLENGREAGYHGAAENRAFSPDEDGMQQEGGGTLRRRYSPRRKKSSRRRGRGRGADEDQDSDAEVRTLTREERQRALDILATIRIKRKARKSLKRSASQPHDSTQDEPDEVYEEVGLPSTRILWVKGLAERMHDKASAEVAKSLRESYADYDPQIVESAARKGWARRKAQAADILKQIDIWSSHFREIEGRFGSATASYFRFTRWLLFLNFYTFLVSFLVIVMPFFLSTQPGDFIPNLDIHNPQPIANASAYFNQAVQCTATYKSTIKNFTDNESTQDKVLDFFVGTGWMERTSMFYGFYHNRTFESDDHYTYNMGLAYMLSIGITFLISFVLILLNSSHSVKSSVVDDQERSSVHFTNSVLCGWDYCIFEEKAAKSKKKILHQEFKTDLLEQSKRLQRQNRSYNQKMVLVIIRIVVNFAVLCILGGTIYLIYFTTSTLIDLREQTDDQVLLLLIQLLPSVTITFLNFVIPLLFEVLVSFEDYWPAFQLKITLFRTVFLRLSSLGVLLFSLYYSLLWPKDKGTFFCAEENKNDTKCCGNFLWEGKKRVENESSDAILPSGSGAVQCWETYVGQQFYKLALVDFAALLLITFVVEFPRKLFYQHFRDRWSLMYKYGQQEFDIPTNVLDIVYSQTLSWLGTFFAPLLPAITLLKVFLIFYIKKLTLMKNMAPPQQVYKVSRSNSFFNIILLISFLLVAIIIGYMIGNIHPSKSCGPYRVYSEDDYVTWEAMTNVIAGWPDWVAKIFFFFGTTTFFVPCFIVLCLMMYYYWAVGQGYKRMDEILQEQLKLEGKDKQFLLARVNYIIKQGNLQGVSSSPLPT